MQPQVRRAFREALLSAFPTQSRLEMLVEDILGESLNRIAPTGTLEQVVFELVKYAISEGKEETLLRGAVAENPGNPALNAFAKAHLPPTAPTDTAPSPAVPQPAYGAPPTPVRKSLDFDEIDLVVQTALRYRCDRDLLLAWIHDEVVRGLAVKPSPSAQILADVQDLNTKTVISQAESPIYLWLRNLAGMIRPYPEAVQINAIRDRLKP